MQPQNISIKDIDVNFDFTSDTPSFWDSFWENGDGYGHGGADPDAKSRTLRQYHQALWSRQLPNGEKMDLVMKGQGLKWKDLWFGSDSITASFRHSKDASIIDQVTASMTDYHSFVEEYLRKLYTIGGMIILPCTRWSLNQARGCSPRIRDRWDLTLDCIRRHYIGDDNNPLAKSFAKEENQTFFKLFVDFKGYVDYFFLQDLVTEDYKSVNLWLDTPQDIVNPIPNTVDEYMSFIKAELEFVRKRNQRIADYISRQ